MKNLKVTVNGVTYDVQVEEQTAGTPVSAAAPAAPKTTVQMPAATVPAPAEKPLVAPAANQPAENEEILKSPMPGAIVDVKVQSGQKVKSGDVLLILEAMKMENEIMAPHDAVVGSILVTKGQSVESATPLVSLR